MTQKLREPVSGLTHLAAAVVSAFGLALLLVIGRGGAAKIVSLAVYGVSLILMFSASASYHMVQSTPGVIRWLRKLDHSSIFLLIAGTYTPICLHFFTGFWKWGLLAVIWSIAAIGIGIKMFILKAPHWLNAAIFLVMGWLSLAAIKEIIATMPPGALTWLVLGGVFFTLGAVVYIAKKPDPWPGRFGFHEIWHIFVIFGCASHFILIAWYIAPRIIAEVI